MNKIAASVTVPRFAYSRDQQRQLIEILNKARRLNKKGAQAEPLRQPVRDKIMEQVTALAGHFQILHGRRPDRVGKARVRTELAGLLEHLEGCKQLLDALSPEVSAYLSVCLDNSDEPLVEALTSPRLSVLVDRIIEALRLAMAQLGHGMINSLPAESIGMRKLVSLPFPAGNRMFPSRGRPRNEAALSFAVGLCAVYFTATGRLPGRQYPADNGRKPGGLFRAFLDAAVRPTGLLGQGQSIDHLVRASCTQFVPPQLRQQRDPSRRTRQGRMAGIPSTSR